MSFIKRGNLTAMPFIENIINTEIRHISVKIGVPIVIHQSLNTLTKYKGDDPLGYKKIKTKKDKLSMFLSLVKHLYKIKKDLDVKYKDKKLIKIIITKNNRIGFVYEKKK